MNFLYIKALASLLVICGSGYAGILYSEKFKNRVDQLVDLIDSLNAFSFNIAFLEHALHDAMQSLSPKDKTIKFIFKEISEKLKNPNCTETIMIFKDAICKHKENLFITNEDIEILVDFATNLGTGDKEHEINNIKLAVMKLKLSEESAREEKKIKQKLYKGIGFLIGIFIVVLLI